MSHDTRQLEFCIYGIVGLVMLLAVAGFAHSGDQVASPDPGEFPAHDAVEQIQADLASVDFIHRSGAFRNCANGKLVEFGLPPYGSITYLNAEADLRDVPLGTFCTFSLTRDSRGQLTRLAGMRDWYSIDARRRQINRIEEIDLSHRKLVMSSKGTGRFDVLLASRTRAWRGTHQIELSELHAGDELLYNQTSADFTNPGRCTEIWVGEATQQLATEQQRKRFSAFQKARGLPGWIDADEGGKLTVTLFSGDPKTFQQTWMSDFKIGGEIKVVVANDELRTWNPPVDNERGTLLEIQNTPADAYGTSGVRLVFTVAHMLEGFRKRRVVRIFGPGWPLTDPPFGEGLMNYGYGPLRDSELAENLPKEYPSQFPFRTDFGNADLPWYKLMPGVVPPRLSEHLVLGELTKVDPDNRSGGFRTDQTGDIVTFSLIPQGAARHKNTNKPDDNGPARFDDVSASVRYLNADAKLCDIPLGTRCRFHLYQDERGAFTRASLVSDEFSYLSENFVSYRIESINLEEGKLFVARQLPPVKNYNGDMGKPPDVGRTELLIAAATRVWRGHEPLKTADLKVGDSLLVNVTGEQPDSPSHCTDIWVQ